MYLQSCGSSKWGRITNTKTKKGTPLVVQIGTIWNLATLFCSTSSEMFAESEPGDSPSSHSLDNLTTLKDGLLLTGNHAALFPSLIPRLLFSDLKLASLDAVLKFSRRSQRGEKHEALTTVFDYSSYQCPPLPKLPKDDGNGSPVTSAANHVILHLDVKKMETRVAPEKRWLHSHADNRFFPFQQKGVRTHSLSIFGEEYLGRLNFKRHGLNSTANPVPRAAFRPKLTTLGPPIVKSARANAQFSL